MKKSLAFGILFLILIFSGCGSGNGPVTNYSGTYHCTMTLNRYGQGGAIIDSVTIINNLVLVDPASFTWRYVTASMMVNNILVNLTGTLYENSSITLDNSVWLIAATLYTNTFSGSVYYTPEGQYWSGNIFAQRM